MSHIQLLFEIESLSWIWYNCWLPGRIIPTIHTRELKAIIVWLIGILDNNRFGVCLLGSCRDRKIFARRHLADSGIDIELNMRLIVHTSLSLTAFLQLGRSPATFILNQGLKRLLRHRYILRCLQMFQIVMWWRWTLFVQAHLAVAMLSLALSQILARVCDKGRLA